MKEHKISISQWHCVLGIARRLKLYWAISIAPRGGLFKASEAAKTIPNGKSKWSVCQSVYVCVQT